MSAPRVFAFIALLSGAALSGRAAVTVHPLFCDGMVLQRDAKVPVWGRAAPGESVRVEFGGQIKSGIADAGGRWRVSLDPMPASAAGRNLVVSSLSAGGQPPAVIRNAVVGEVWLCSGQSNMDWHVNMSKDAAEEIRSAGYPLIRMFSVKKTLSDVPLETVEGDDGWKEAVPAHVGVFSAVGYFFGRELYRDLGVPVGLIEASWGASMAEAWTRRQTLLADPDYAPFLERYVANGPAHKLLQNAPSTLYNAMIHPLAPYALRGAIWYQGEGNADRACLYRKLLPAMIADWRTLWPEQAVHFGIVSLANFMAAVPQPYDSSWAELREAQAITARMPCNGLAVTIDIGDAQDIHPKNKQEAGRRLALWARAKVYDRPLVYSGPVYESMEMEGGRLRLRFGHAEGGLVAAGGPLKTFAVAGEDRVFYWADAVVDGETVVAGSPAVPVPVAVRYAWAENPEGCNLYNQAGLPAVPFRTDTWPGKTDAVR